MDTLIIGGRTFPGVTGIKATDDNSVVQTFTKGGGGSSVAAKDVNFYDYNGSIVASYTTTEFASLTALPANPSHDGLTARGWNWTLVNAKTYVQKYGKLDVGQMYRTTSGDTEMDCVFDDPNYLSPWLAIAVNGEVEVDWGDGSTKDTMTGTSNTTLKYQQHVYAQTGNYTIKIHVVSGQFTFYGALNYASVLRMVGEANNRARNRAYSGTIQHIRIGSDARIGNYAFSFCSYLQSITIPDSVTSIGSNAFGNCYSLQGINIPDGVTSIESSAFTYCSFMLTISIPHSVTSIGSSGFNSCYSLRSIVIPDSVTAIGIQAFYYNYSLKYITIPDGITSIANYVVQNCYSLQGINIPDSVTSIGSQTFSNCSSLRSIVIPDSVTSIDSQAFYNCYGMLEYHFLPETPPTLANTNAFSNIMSDTVIYVPYSADHSILNAYKTETNWSTYATYMQEEPQ